MDTLVYISAAALVFVIVMVFVNARRVSDLRTEVENIPESEGYTYRDSSLSTTTDGGQVPKKYYWVTVKSVMISGTSEKDGEVTATIVFGAESITSFDNLMLFADIINGRIKSIYRPENMIVIGVTYVKPTTSNNNGTISLTGRKDILTNIPSGKGITFVGMPVEKKSISI
jgi:hypothetical protein